MIAFFFHGLPTDGVKVTHAHIKYSYCVSHNEVSVCTDNAFEVKFSENLVDVMTQEETSSRRLREDND